VTAEHTPPAGGADDGAGADWFHVLDVAVWVAVGVIAVIAAEWFVGYLVREKISRGAGRYLQRVTPVSDTGSD
jgi:hypothetical protein